MSKGDWFGWGMIAGLAVGGILILMDEIFTMPNPYEHFEAEIARTVIGPRIYEVYHTDPDGITSKQALYEAFNKMYPVSRSVFERWLGASGIKMGNAFWVEAPILSPTAKSPLDDPVVEAVQSLGQSD
jgi:hypothetical protein